jgi:hypothetical protein
MDIYLRSSRERYLCADSGLVTLNSAQADYNSLLVVSTYDPVKRGPAADTIVRSNGLVTLRNRSGMLVTPQPADGMLRLGVSGGLNAAPQIGHDVLRLFKISGEKNEAVHYGDTVVLRFTTGGDAPQEMWMAADGAGGVVFTPVERPGEMAYFTLLPPIDLVDFLAEYDDVTNTILCQAMMSGPLLPGGHTMRIESPDGADIVSPMQIVLEESNIFSVPLTGAFNQLSPCSPREITLRASYAAGGARLEERVRLEGDRALFMTMKVLGAKKIKSALPLFKGQPAIEVSAALGLDQSAKRLAPSNMPLMVNLSTVDPALRNFSQEGTQVGGGKAVKFTFQIQQPTDNAPPTCALITARYKLDGRMRDSQFAAKISAKGIALDAQ